MSIAVGCVCLYGDHWSKTYKITGPPELRLEANEANITVTPWDRSEIQADVETTGWKISDADVKVLENHAGNVLELQVETPQLRFEFSRRSVKVAIQVPRETGCEIRAGFGNIAIEGVKGRIVLSSSHGSINATDLDGKLEANTGEGKVRAGGRLNLLTIRSGFGAIDVDAAAGSRMFSEWRVSSDDGEIVLHLPPAFAADLDARTEAGKVKVDLPFKVTGDADASTLQGKINGGGEALVLRTSGGNIKVVKSSKR